MEVDENRVFAELGRLYLRSQVQADQLRQVVAENHRLSQRLDTLEGTVAGAGSPTDG